MKKTNLCIYAPVSDQDRLIRMMKKSKADITRKSTLYDDDDNVAVKIEAEMPTKRYRKISAKLMKFADVEKVLG